MGSYSADSKVIRIHPALDQPLVPRFFVEWIVFHEMLHHVYRARRGRRRAALRAPAGVHGARAPLPRLPPRAAWENENLDLLLRARVG